MARYTTAYSSLVRRIGEVDLLVSIAAKKELEDAIIHHQEIDALCRGAIVLLSSHLEAFIKDLGILAEGVRFSV